MDVEVLQRFFQQAAICLPCLCQYLDLSVRQTFASDVSILSSFFPFLHSETCLIKLSECVFE